MINDLEIDLTENRDFSKASFSIIEEVMNKRINEALGILYPWSICPRYKEYRYSSLLPIGNKKQRKAQLLYNEWGTKNSTRCDCCGRKVGLIPWKKYFGLCFECEKEYCKKKDEVREFPWNTNIY
jgi:ribosomal protein S14